tara:strand:+ start:47 stop:277 length:231 start_codon:yes stop_codon:yes gene_type:complete
MPNNIIKELRIRKELELILKERYIDFNNYFRYSGEVEKTQPMTAYLIEKERKYSMKFTRGIKNDMTKYKLKNAKHN